MENQCLRSAGNGCREHVVRRLAGHHRKLLPALHCSPQRDVLLGSTGSYFLHFTVHLREMSYWASQEVTSFTTLLTSVRCLTGHHRRWLPALHSSPQWDVLLGITGSYFLHYTVHLSEMSYWATLEVTSCTIHFTSYMFNGYRSQHSFIAQKVSSLGHRKSNKESAYRFVFFLLPTVLFIHQSLSAVFFSSTKSLLQNIAVSVAWIPNGAEESYV